MKSIQQELPLDFRDIKSADWLLKHPQCMTFSIRFLKDIDLSKPAAGQYPEKQVHMISKPIQY